MRGKEIKAKNVLSIFIVVTFIVFLISNNGSSLDLLTAVQMAKKVSPQLLASKFEHQATLTLPKQARASLLPQITTTYSWARLDYHTAPPTYFDYNSYNFKITLQQSIINLPYWVEYSQSKVKTNMSELKLINDELDLIRQVSEAYFEVLYATDYLNVLLEEKKALGAYLEMIKKLYEKGEATLTDVHDVEAKYSDVIFRIVSQEKNLHAAKSKLSGFIGESDFEIKPLSENFILKELDPADIESWKTLAKKKSPIINYYLKAQELAEQEIKKQSYTAYPKVDLIASYTKSTSVEYLRTEPISYSLIGFQISLPIFTGGYITAKKEEAIEKSKQVDAQYKKVLVDLNQQITESFFGVKTAYAQILAAETALRAAKIALESTKKGFEAGLRTIVDLLDAESNHHKAKYNLVKARYDYLKNYISLKYYTGILSDSDIEEINKWISRN